MIKSFKNLIGDEKRYLAKKAIPDKETVFCVFREVVQEYFGKIGLEKIMPDYFFAGGLFIKTQNAAWLSEFWENRKEIIQKMNKKIGEDFVKEVKIKE